MTVPGRGERRRMPRVAKPWLLDVARARADQPHWYRVDVVNLGVLGVQFVSEALFDLGETVVLRFNLPVPEPSIIHGKVLWRTPASAGPGHRYGASFGGLGATTMAKLNEFLDWVQSHNTTEDADATGDH